jgi:hypothetical protein
MLAGGDPPTLDASAGALRGTVDDVTGLARDLGSTAREAAGAVGVPALAAALERFAAAWTGELLAGGCDVTMLSAFAGMNADQLRAATGGS